MADVMFDDCELIDVEMEVDGIELEADIEPAVNLGSTNDYNQLINRPKINGTVLHGNYNEIDPTVPDWAKQENKPQYSAEEVGALNENNEMGFANVKAIWDSVFKN